MKKILLAIITLGTALTSFGQVSITAEGSTTDISGTTVNVPVDLSQSVSFVKFHVKNESGATINMSIGRVLLTSLPQSGPTSWTDEVCWSVIAQGSIGTCYPTSGTSWTSPAEEIGANQEGELKPQVTPQSVDGTLKTRYYIKSGNVLIDSIDVQWTTQALSVKENNPAEITMSVYPNPATSVLTISANNFEGAYSIKMTDVLGKVILEQKASGTEKIDVSDFKNGVYLVTVYTAGKAVTTRRIVVKH